MQNIKDFYTGSVIARIITSVLLIIALSNQQIGYYKFLRWIVCITAVYAAFISYIKKEKLNFGIWLFGLIALLFNPIVPFYLGKSSWQVVDIIVGIIFIGSTFFIKEENRDH